MPFTHYDLPRGLVPDGHHEWKGVAPSGARCLPTGPGNAYALEDGPKLGGAFGTLEGRSSWRLQVIGSE